jgi:hypothetical protein
MLEKIRRLESIVKDEEKAEINEILFFLFEHMSKTSEKKAVAHIRREKEENEGEKREEIINKIKELNKLAEKTPIKIIYEGGFGEESIKDFILEITNEAFNKRNIKRR